VVAAAVLSVKAPVCHARLQVSYMQQNTSVTVQTLLNNGVSSAIFWHVPIVNSTRCPMPLPLRASHADAVRQTASS
jgi:hypothetical protein